MNESDRQHFLPHQFIFPQSLNSCRKKYKSFLKMNQNNVLDYFSEPKTTQEARNDGITKVKSKKELTSTLTIDSRSSSLSN